jgi:hypothetical protein
MVLELANERLGLGTCSGSVLITSGGADGGGGEGMSRDGGGDGGG